MTLLTSISAACGRFDLIGQANRTYLNYNFIFSYTIGLIRIHLPKMRIVVTGGEMARDELDAITIFLRGIRNVIDMDLRIHASNAPLLIQIQLSGKTEHLCRCRDDLIAALRAQVAWKNIYARDAHLLPSKL